MEAKTCVSRCDSFLPGMCFDLLNFQADVK